MTDPVPASPHADATGLLLFAHGARDPMWAQPFEAVARACRAVRGEDKVALAFLDFMTPDMVAAGTRLAQAGCSAVDVVPLFLGAGGHVRKDIPVLRAKLQAEHPAVRWTLRPAVGESPLLVAAMAEVALAAASSAEVAVR